MGRKKEATERWRGDGGQAACPKTMPVNGAIRLGSLGTAIQAPEVEAVETAAVLEQDADWEAESRQPNFGKKRGRLGTKGKTFRPEGKRLSAPSAAR